MTTLHHLDIISLDQLGESIDALLAIRGVIRFDVNYIAENCTNYNASYIHLIVARYIRAYWSDKHNYPNSSGYNRVDELLDGIRTHLETHGDFYND